MAMAESIDKAFKITKVLDDIKKKRTASAPEAAAPEKEEE